MMQEDNQNSNQFLSEEEQIICADVQQFLVKTSKQLENRMVAKSWKSYLKIINNPSITTNIRLACCSALKALIYFKNFVEQPTAIFAQISSMYIKAPKSQADRKVAEVSQIILEALCSYFTDIQKWQYCKKLTEQLFTDPLNSQRIFKFIKLMIRIMNAELINNQVLIGQMLLFLDKCIHSDFQESNKINLSHQALQIIDCIITTLQQQIEDEQSFAQGFFRNHNSSKKILFEIISSSNQQSIITQNHQLNQLKAFALGLYRKTWIYSPDSQLFRLSFLTLLNKPHLQLIDSSIEIIQSCVILLQRSLAQPQNQYCFHLNCQAIVINLFHLLKPQESLLSLQTKDPEYFVELEEDFCLQQQCQVISAKIGSLLAYLCLNVDGYMTFIGTLCIMVVKRLSIQQQSFEGADGYFQSIDSIWPVPFEQQVAICVHLLAALSDQIQKRKDLYNPLMNLIRKQRNKFKIGQCQFPPYIICRFMLLYSFYPQKGCLTIFFPYRSALPLYQFQLQACYRILQKYSSRSPQLKEYLLQVGSIIIISTSKLTPMLQNIIVSKPQMLKAIQYNILQKLSLWMYQSYECQNFRVCNKISNLITKLIENFYWEEQQKDQMKQIEEEGCNNILPTQITVFQYLKKNYQQLGSKAGNPLEHNIIQIAKYHVQKFKKAYNSNNNNIERIQYFMSLSYQVVHRNNCTLNNCLDLFAELTAVMPSKLIYNLIENNLQWLHRQQRSQDKWQSFYLLEICAIRLKFLNEPLPSINFHLLLHDVRKVFSKTLLNRAQFCLYSMVMCDPINQIQLEQYLSNKPLPECVSPNQNKPYCLYLMSLVKYVEYLPENMCVIIQKIVDCLQREQNIAFLVKSYEENLYQMQSEQEQTAMNAHMKMLAVPHPLATMKIDLFQQFKQTWLNFKHRDSFMNGFSPEFRKKINEVIAKTVVNSKARTIYRVSKNIYQ